MAPNLSLYNQNTLSDDDFVANFVARHDVLKTLLRRLSAIEMDSQGNHQILIGPRGMGKTSLLRRVAIEINRKPNLAARFVPLSFREEQYNVLSLGDFWRNCGEALAEWAEATDQGDLASRLDAALPTKAWAGDENSLEQFNAEMRGLNRRAVLLVDNLDLILDALSDNDQWVLRRHLQVHQAPIMIGAATQPLKESRDRDAAFYEFFQPHYLEPLDQHETETCMRALARRRSNHGEHVLEVLDKQPERLKTLHTLTGGNPRILALIYRLLETAESDVAMADLEILLDQVTPYYKARIEEYQTSQQRAVIDAIALNWDPIKTGDLSRVTNIVTTTLSPLLSKLRKDGLIESTETSGAYAAHQLVERFLNIWYLMRHGTRRTKQKMRWLVGFLTSFYSSHELAEISDRAKARGMTSSWPADYAAAFEQALAYRVLDGEDIGRRQLFRPVRGAANPLESNLGEIGKATSEARLSGTNGVQEIGALIDEGDSLRQRGEYAAAIVAYDAVVGRFADADEAELRLQVAWALGNKADTLEQMGEHRAAIAAYDEILARFADADETELRVQVAWVLGYKGDMLRQLSDHTAAIAAYDAVVTRFADAGEAELREPVAWALGDKGDTLVQMGDHTAAIAAYDEVVTRFAAAGEAELRERVASALGSKGDALVEIGDHIAAIAVYKEVITRFANADETELRVQVAWALNNEGRSLEQTGDHAAAIAAYDEVVTRFADVDDAELGVQAAWALNNKGRSLGRMGDHTAAITAYDQVVTRFADAEGAELRAQVAVALNGKGRSLGQMGDHSAAIAVHDTVVARFANADEAELRVRGAWALNSKGRSFEQMGDHTAALTAYDEVVARFAGADEPELRAQVVVALGGRGHLLRQTGDHTAAIAVYLQILDLLGEESIGPFPAIIARIRILLGNLLIDFRGEIAHAEALYKAAVDFDPLLANGNLAWLYISDGRLSDALLIRSFLKDVPAPGLALLDSAIELVRDNFGLATDHLAAALDRELKVREIDFTDDFDRLLRLAESRGYGERLLAWFEETAFADRFAPVYVAFQAYVRDEKLLLDVNPEVRGPASIIYDRLDAPRRYRRERAPQQGKSKSRGRPRKV